MEERDIFAEKLFAWYENNRRNFSWRKTNDPYRILVAEMMLQKTTSRQVAELFDKFVEKYPSPQFLANAPLAEIEDLITPLGMEHKKARRFKKWAEELVSKFSGKVPHSKGDLISLPGVGEYIANAVLCLAYNEDVPLLDTNVARVLQRVFRLGSTKARARTDKSLWRAYEAMIPKGKAKNFNLAVIDFAAMICTARNPKHDICPIKDICQFYRREYLP